MLVLWRIVGRWDALPQAIYATMEKTQHQICTNSSEKIKQVTSIWLMSKQGRDIMTKTMDEFLKRIAEAGYPASNVIAIHTITCRALLREVLAEATYRKQANLSHDLIKRIKETLEG